MNLVRCRLLAGLLLLLLPWTPALAADPAPAPSITPAQAQSLADTLQDDAKRTQLISTLRTLAAATTTAPATPVALKPGGLGDQVVGHATEWFASVAEQVDSSVREVRALPALLRWFGRLGTDADLRDLVARAAGLALAIVAVSAVAMRLLSRMIQPVLRAVERGPPPENPVPRHGRAWRVTKRLPWALLRALVGLVPAAGFAAVGNLLAGTSVVELEATRVITLDAVNTYVLYRLVLAVSELLFGAESARLRLFDVTDATATYATTWVRRLARIALSGGLLANVAGILGVPRSATQAILKLAALAVHVALVVVTFQCRDSVATRIAAWASGHRLVGEITPRLARRWVWTATFFNMLLWFVWVSQPAGGFAEVIRIVLVTFGILVGARLLSILLLGGLDRVFSHAGTARRALWHRRLRTAVGVAMSIAAVVALLQSWGVDLAGWFEPGRIGARLLSTFGTVWLVVAIAAVVWELVTASLERNLRHLSENGRTAQAQRLRTLTPLLRTCLLIVILVVVVLTALSEVGVNVAPLLAGASIFGVALGFGAQKLVQDFITGIFLLLENAMQVGEWVTVAGLSGTVEQLSIRTIQLRGGDGSLYVIPFSSVTTVNNINRGIGNATVSVTVSAAVDTDVVGEEIKRIGAEMRDDPAFADLIRSDLALWGVDRIDASTATLAGQIECTDAGRWGVQREFNRRVKKRFGELGIPLANPATVVMLQPMPSVPAQSQGSDPGESAASAAVSPPPHG